MPIFSQGVRTLNTSLAANAAIEYYTTGYNKPRLLELGITIPQSTSSSLGLGRPSTVGVNPTPLLFAAENVSDAVTRVASAVQWSSQPGVPANFFRRVNFNGTFGFGVIFTFPKGITISVSSSLVIWNIVAGSVIDVYAVIED